MVRSAPAEGQTQKLTSCTQRWLELHRQRVERKNSLAVFREGQNCTGRGSNGETHPLHSEMVRIALAKVRTEELTRCTQRWSESHWQSLERRNLQAVLKDGQNRTGRGSNGETHALYSEIVRIAPAEGRTEKLTSCTRRWCQNHTGREIG